MGLQGRRIESRIMTGQTQAGLLLLEQGGHRRGVALMAGHAVTAGRRFMHTQDPCRCFVLIVTIKTYPGRWLIQESGIFAGVNTMAGLTVTALHRCMLRRCGDPFMAAETQVITGLRGENLICRAFMATVTTVAQRRMDDLAQQPGISGTVLGMAIGTTAGHRILVVGGAKISGRRRMTGSAQLIAGQGQQAGLIRHMRAVAVAAAVSQWRMDGVTLKGFGSMAFKTELFVGDIQ